MWTNARHGVGALSGLGDIVPVPQAPVGNRPPSGYDASGSPAGTPRESMLTGAPMGPITLVPPMPSITPPPPHEVTPEDGAGLCALNQWVARNPALAVLGAVAVYSLLRGSK